MQTIRGSKKWMSSERKDVANDDLGNWGPSIVSQRMHTLAPHLDPP